MTRPLMSLISNTDFLIQSIRLAYLQTVEDPYGPRIITSDSSSNPYVIEASLVEKWPPTASPQLSEDDGERPSGFPGAKLKYTQTIMGGRSGGLGLRVHGKRNSTSKRISTTPDVKNFVTKNEAMNVDETLTKTPATVLASVLPPAVQIQEPTVNAAPTAPVAKAVQFVPKFKGAAEMEARRRIRMARRLPGATKSPIPVDSSSSSEDEPTPAPETDTTDIDFGNDDSMDDGDEFDPDFIHTDEFSTVQSLSSVSPVPLPSRRPRQNADTKLQSNDAKRAPNEKSVRKPPSTAHLRPGNLPPSASSAPATMFSRRKVPPIKRQQSALTAMLASSTSSSNPFSETYAAISGRSEGASSNVLVYFPHATNPAGKAMELNVRKDATVEEVLGFALLNYWEEGWLPKLDEGLNGEEDPKWVTRLSAVGWVMRIAEEDGEIDDDFPPPDRTGKIVKFHADAYAVLEATVAQIAQNQILESKIRSSPSHATVKKKASMPTLGVATSGVMSMSSALTTSALSTSLSTSLGPSTSGPPIFLRVRVADTADADSVHFSTTIPVSAGMYMQEALELVCRRKNLSDPKAYTLMLAELPIVVPLDRTVASLQGKRELVLVKKSMLGNNVLNAAGKTTDPNASIFKRMSDAPETKLSSALDYMSSYKKYTIYRKMPMLVARQERTLALDGVYIHIMPSNKAKAVFDSGKTWSYHIKSIDCQQTTKLSSTFRLLLNRAGGLKRYEFEAESPKLAHELVQNVKSLKAALERSGTTKTSRKSRQVEGRSVWNS